MVSVQKQGSSFSCLVTEAGGWPETVNSEEEKSREDC